MAARLSAVHFSYAGVLKGAMSSLRAIDLTTVDDLVDFVRGRGYVLHFSDRPIARRNVRRRAAEGT